MALLGTLIKRHPNSKFKHKDMDEYVSLKYIEHFFSQDNPYTESEYYEVYGVFVFITFSDLFRNDWSVSK